MILYLSELVFKNPPCTTMITVQKGVEWFGAESSDAKVVAKEKGAPPEVHGLLIRIFKTALYRMCDIPSRWIREWFYIPTCNDHDALLDIMREYYDDVNFETEEICTVIYFEVKA